MEKKNIGIKKVTTKAGKNAKDLLNKTKSVANRVVDKNNDGKFDKKDVEIITEAIKENANDKKVRMELKWLQPIFDDTLIENDFYMSKLIRVAERDKKHIDSDVCQGSIGYFSDVKGVRIINIFTDCVDSFNIALFPDASSEFYYVDPIDSDKYISLDDYFGYLKMKRVAELQKIAQDLGATHFKVTYKEEKTYFSKKVLKGNAKGNLKSKTGSINADYEALDNEYSTIEVAAETSFPGHIPQKPKLEYLKRDPSIQNLVALRMDEASPMKHQKFMIKLSNSSGLKENDAVKIDAVLKALKCTGNVTVVSEVKNEARRYFEYEIDF